MGPVCSDTARSLDPLDPDGTKTVTYENRAFFIQEKPKVSKTQTATVARDLLTYGSPRERRIGKGFNKASERFSYK